MSTISKGDSPRGVPRAPFLNEEFISSKTLTEIDEILVDLQDQYKKYQFMEKTFQRKQESLNSKMPEIQSTLGALELVARKKGEEADFITDFELTAGSLYARATIPPTDKVGLWLGANVMLEYPVEEAKELLTKNLAVATANAKALEGDLEFIKEQLTTMEVNIARVYNRGVKARKSGTPSAQ